MYISDGSMYLFSIAGHKLISVQKRFLGWPRQPIPGLSISTSGLLALADLTTTAKRTALTGTAIWLDILVLAPGLHYQQAAETLATSPISKTPEVTNLNNGRMLRVTNTATIHYLQRVGRTDSRVVLDVGCAERHKCNRAGGTRSEIFPGVRKSAEYGPIEFRKPRSVLPGS